MKRLILILITGMFLCNISYGASISELLKGGKSIKLICTIEKARGWFEHEITDKKDIPSLIGDELFFEIKEKSFTISASDWIREEEYLIGITKSNDSGTYKREDEFPMHGELRDGSSEEFENEGSIEINNNYFLLSHSTYLPSDRYYKDIYDKIKINRFTG